MKNVLYGNIKKEKEKFPIKAGGRMENGKLHYGNPVLQVVGYKTIEFTYDVNPDYPEDKVLLSQREVSRKFI